MNTQTQGINQEKMQEFFGSMISKMNEQGTDSDPFGALKSLQQVAEAWVKNPQELNQSMQNWSQKISEVNMKVWNEFANKSKESIEKGEFGKISKNFQKYFTFAFVRNPFDKVVSEYHWYLKYGPKCTFKEWVMGLPHRIKLNK